MVGAKTVCGPGLAGTKATTREPSSVVMCSLLKEGPSLFSDRLFMYHLTQCVRSPETPQLLELLSHQLLYFC